MSVNRAAGGRAGSGLPRGPGGVASSRVGGFTLVEVLVSLLVTSLGLLGVCKLVVFSARPNDSAYLRSQAVAQGYAILDAMRANRQAALTGSYSVTTLSSYSYTGTDCAATGASCSAGTLAQYDLGKRKSRMQEALGPSGDGKIATASVPNATTGLIDVTATITVQWDDTVAQQAFGSSAQYATVVLESVL